MGEQTAKAPGLNRAKTYQLVLFPLNNGATNVYYVLVLSYIATFGSKVLALSMLFASVMVTATLPPTPTFQGWVSATLASLGRPSAMGKASRGCSLSPSGPAMTTQALTGSSLGQAMR